MGGIILLRVYEGRADAYHAEVLCRNDRVFGRLRRSVRYRLDREFTASPFMYLSRPLMTTHLIDAVIRSDRHSVQTSNTNRGRPLWRNR